jgi:hypothetical protein
MVTYSIIIKFINLITGFIVRHIHCHWISQNGSRVFCVLPFAKISNAKIISSERGRTAATSDQRMSKYSDSGIFHDKNWFFNSMKFIISENLSLGLGWKWLKNRFRAIEFRADDYDPFNQFYNFVFSLYEFCVANLF